jgi:hypothetical protein
MGTKELRVEEKIALFLSFGTLLRHLLSGLFRLGNRLCRLCLLFHNAACIQAAYWNNHHNLVITFYRLSTTLNLTIES